jgi:hypothetical protein
VALAILTVAYVIMLIANISPPPNSGMQCPWQFPKILSCVLGTNLAGGVLGAGGALFAAWIAWKVVQHQLRHTMMVERAYISGGGGALVEEPNLFLLTVQNYGKTPGTVTAYALFVCDRADLPPEPAYLAPEYTPTTFHRNLFTRGQNTEHNCGCNPAVGSKSNRLWTLCGIETPGAAANTISALFFPSKRQMITPTLLVSVKLILARPKAGA